MSRSNRSHLSEDEIMAELRFLFSMADRDGGGTIEKEEFRELLSLIGSEASATEIDYWLGDNDNNGDGVIDFEEFCNAMKKDEARGRAFGWKESLAAFTVHDSLRPTGRVNALKLIEALQYYAPKDQPVSKEEAEELVGHMKLDENNTFDYIELLGLFFDEGGPEIKA